MILQQRVVWGLPMRFKSELTIRAAWRIVASGLEQWAQTGSIEPEHLATVRTVQINMAQHLAKFEDGPAVLFTAWSKRRQLRHIEQMASDLICLSEQRASRRAVIREWCVDRQYLPNFSCGC